MSRPHPACHPLDGQHGRWRCRQADLIEGGVVDVAEPPPGIRVLLSCVFVFLLDELLALVLLPHLLLQGLLIHIALHHGRFQEITGAESPASSGLGLENDVRLIILRLNRQITRRVKEEDRILHYD